MVNFGVFVKQTVVQPRVQWALLLGGEAFWAHACAALSAPLSGGISADHVANASFASLLYALTPPEGAAGGAAFDRMATEEGLFCFLSLYHDIATQQANAGYTVMTQVR